MSDQPTQEHKRRRLDNVDEPSQSTVTQPSQGNVDIAEGEVQESPQVEQPPPQVPFKPDGFGVELLPRIAEKEGFNLAQFEEGVWETLALAVEYKLRTLVDEALRICRRNMDRQSELCLDSRSILLALKLLRWEKVPPACLRSRAGDRKSLNEYLEEDMNAPLPVLPKLSVKWVGLNGKIVNPEYVRNCSPHKDPTTAWHYVPNTKAFKRDFVNAQSHSKFVMSVIFDDHSTEPVAVGGSDAGPVKILAIPRGLVDTLGEEQRLFLERISAVVTTAVRDSNGSQRAQIRVALDKVIRSLSEGRIPQTLVPYILSLLCGEISNVVLDGTPEGALILLDLLRAFCQNQSVQLHAYLHQMLQALFTCMLTPLIGGASPTAIHSAISVRRSAAEILAATVTQSASVSGSPAVYSSAMEIISEVLMKPSLPLPTLLGAIFGAKALGPLAIRRCVLPVTRDLIEALKMSLRETSPNMEVAEIREFLKSTMLEALLACTHITQKRDNEEKDAATTMNMII
eukprot:Blabericola_migrator_1__4645@NODE_245_length_10909_cov_149_723298_g207_i0_p2_GENE_NODE_245_length_10909_cov_149_723298_g207_i0NODE_245_length_10909_cov_149_723298_g207_i0_p2_ORF_typecomplete_len513_score69_67TAF6_C/PF07571_13/2_7e10TAF/PF02969_17/0_054TAF/PF02969_17/1_6e03TAF4/PF05236_14/0_18_NODE_245_length_10909_cov_149_723298_g207_i084239961